ncbi:MAG: adenosine deaminase [Spirochaetes bacterium DG_61]|jgi:adenosine deaminase|nr:MAG: adenosine deaminase [Spirochaetes bacterium DG_61]
MTKAQTREKQKKVVLSEELIRKIPKVLLHDHLDGGLRPHSIIELSKSHRLKLPENDSEKLSRWFFEGSNRGNLREYLKGFKITTGVMQTEEALHRVAFEMMEDMRNDGVVYVETRFSPLFHTRLGLSHEQVVEAVLRGLKEGARAFSNKFGLILCAMRNLPSSGSMEIAKLAVRYREQGVVGFDLAGDELGYPPKDHLNAFYYIQRNNFYITIHAGEAFGKESIWQALQYCGTHRIGHGLHLKDDIMTADGEIIEMGYLSQYVRDRRVPLEVCLSSNLHTGAIQELRYHPFPILLKNGFRVTLNTDNRLMSNTTLTREFGLAVKHFNLEIRDIEKLTLNAMKSAFFHFPERLDIIYNVIKPGFAEIKKSLYGAHGQ